MSLSMPFREPGHVTGDRAFKKFDELFGDWVTRPPVGNDYGVDAEIEIFEADGRATALTFKAQMKGMATKKRAGDPRVQVKTSSLNYWRTLDVPVLVCLYIIDSGEAYARWAHSYDPVVSRTAAVKKSNTEPANTTFTFRPEDRVRADFRERIRADVQALRVLRTRVSNGAIPFEIVAEGFDSGYIDEVTARLQAALLPVPEVMKIATAGDEKPWGTIRIQKRKVRFGMPVELASLTVHGEYGSCEDEGLDGLVADVLTAGAVTFSNTGMSSQATVLCDHFPESSRLSKSPEIAGMLALAYLEQRRHDQAIGLLAPLLLSHVPEDRIAGEWLLVSAYYRYSQYLTPAGTQIMKEVLTRRAAAESANEEYDEAARFVYWRAQIEKSSIDRNLPASLASYDEAGHLSDAYSAREYFHRERGGILADMGRWLEAATCYETARSIGHDSEDLDFVLVDALTHCGQYQEALAAAERGRSSDDSPAFKAKTEIWFAALGWIIEGLGLDRQWRSQILPLTAPEGVGEDLASIKALLQNYDVLDSTVVYPYVNALGSEVEESDVLGPVLALAISTLDNGAFWLLAAHVLHKCDFPRDVVNSAFDMLLRFDRDNLPRILAFGKAVLPADDFSAMRRRLLSRASEFPTEAPAVLRISLPDGSSEEVVSSSSI